MTVTLKVFTSPRPPVFRDRVATPGATALHFAMPPSETTSTKDGWELTREYPRVVASEGFQTMSGPTGGSPTVRIMGETETSSSKISASSLGGSVGFTVSASGLAVSTWPAGGCGAVVSGVLSDRKGFS